MEYIESMLRFFQQGGAFMVPIAIVLGLGLAIALERYIYLSLAKATNRRVWNQIMPMLQQGKFREAVNKANSSKAAIGKIMSYGLNRMGATRRREDVELAMEEGLMEAIPRLERRTHYLATLANIATLLGLLGTIIGLINAFTAVAEANPAEKADMLSASISVAMNTTAFGLMAGIPLLLIHSVLQTKATEVVDSLEMASVRVMNMLMERGRQEASA
ncbi:MotA/TolQ/ExbB proton channel family protein [Ectothiorhodospiraceae bacterium WFHF3C12]|nr:MotA/TolQ/ExbB proton channel family protein [Ectothiorhodospiraceae bacterium WFHF3C12]